MNDQIRAVSLDHIAGLRLTDCMAHISAEAHAGHACEEGRARVVSRSAYDSYSTRLAFVKLVAERRDELLDLIEEGARG